MEKKKYQSGMLLFSCPYFFCCVGTGLETVGHRNNKKIKRGQNMRHKGGRTGGKYNDDKKNKN